MDDDASSDIERRVRELRGWVRRGTNPRRAIFLATALKDIVSNYPEDHYPDAWAALSEVPATNDPVEMAKIIFNAQEIPSDSRLFKHLDASIGRQPSIRTVGRSYSQPSFAGYRPAEEDQAGAGNRRRKVREGASEYQRELR